MLRYVLGDDAHVRTFLRGDRRLCFEFDDQDGKAEEIAAAFFSEEGIIIGNARQLLLVEKAMRATVGECLRKDEWRNPSCQ